MIEALPGDPDGGALRAAELRRRFDQRVEHRLQIESRAADHLEHVGGGGLLLQRFAQLVDQACIFDRDSGLIGKGPHQSNLRFRERLHLATPYTDDAYQLLFT